MALRKIRSATVDECSAHRRGRFTPIKPRVAGPQGLIRGRGRHIGPAVELITLATHLIGPGLHGVGAGDRRPLAGTDLERHPGEAEQHDLTDQVVEVDPAGLAESGEVEQVALDSVVDAHTDEAHGEDARADHQRLLNERQIDVVDLRVVAPGEAEHHHGQCETEERHHHDRRPVVGHHAEVDDIVVITVPDLDAAVEPHRHQVQHPEERESAQAELLDLAQGEPPFVLQLCTVHSCRFRSNTVADHYITPETAQNRNTCKNLAIS